MKKILIIFINLILILSILYITDDFIFRRECKNNKCTDCKKYYLFKNPHVYTMNLNEMGRKINASEKGHKNPPIVVFGCSFAYGHYLKDEQTFGYKLSKILNRNVINRALIGGGIQHMYFQSTQDDFYKLIPNCKDVIYIYIEDHRRRMLVYTFDILASDFILHYDIKNGKINLANYNNSYLNFIRSVYLFRLINQQYVKYLMWHNRYAEKLADDELKYIIETRNNLEKHWGKPINFTVVFYDRMHIKNELYKKLLENGFNAILLEDELKVELGVGDKKYRIPDGHPSEEAWNVVTPFVAERLPK